MCMDCSIHCLPWLPTNYFRYQALTTKIEAIRRITHPTITTHVRSFVGLINYYKGMWSRRAHILALLTDLRSSKKKFIWTNAHENYSNQAKRLIAEDVLLRFPDYSPTFDTFTEILAIIRLDQLSSKGIYLFFQETNTYTITLLYNKNRKY